MTHLSDLAGVLLGGKKNNPENFTSAELLHILPKTSVGKEEKNHCKLRVQINLPAGRVKNHTHQRDFAQGEEMRAGHI